MSLIFAARNTKNDVLYRLKKDKKNKKKSLQIKNNKLSLQPLLRIRKTGD